MNFHNLNFQYVEQPRHYATRPTLSPRVTSTSNPSQITVIRYHGSIDDRDEASLRHASLSTQPTVVPYDPAPLSSSSSQSSSGIYGPERLYGRRLTPLVMANQTGQEPPSWPRPRYTPEQLQAMALAEHRRVNPVVPMAGRPAEEFRDPLAIEAARVTPGVDDTPYIQYAIEALTREREGESNPPSMISDRQRYVPDEGLGYYRHPNAPITPQTASIRTRDVSRQHEEQSAPLLAAQGRRPSSHHSSMSTLVRDQERSARLPTTQRAPDAWEPVEPELTRDGRERINPRLVFKPKILRPASLIMLMFLCIMMITALIFCAVYSQGRTGLWNYAGTIYDGQYFLFRVFPAMLAAVILFYAQCIVTTMLRIRPFARLASAEKVARQDAIFDELYPRSFLWPQLVGTWHTWVPILITWVMNITLPLQSCLFTVIYVNGTWRWATVQGIAWTLVALYTLLVAAIGIELSSWLKKKTGLLWDPRSIADIAALISHSNSLADYRGTELLGSRDDMKTVLRRRRTDRLSYWGWADHERPDDLWYALGYRETWESPGFESEVLGEKLKSELREKLAQRPISELWANVFLEPATPVPQVLHRYLPLGLNNFFLLGCVAVGFAVILTIFVVSFYHKTRITQGFLPLLSAAPIHGAFSAADFLYSFLPALLGLFLFMAFQDLDLNLRILQPWAELNPSPPGGALPERSILADYAACYPVQSTIHALRNGHWRVAAISLLSTFFVLIPIFAGGMFIALTPADNIVKVFPQVPLFALTLALLVTYWLALIGLTMGKKRSFSLPHGVSCLAEVISFLANDDTVHDETFQGMIRNKTNLVGKLGVNRRDEDKSRWALMTGGVGYRDGRLGVKRVRRYTQRPLSPTYMEGIWGPGRERLLAEGNLGTLRAAEAMVAGLGTNTSRESRRDARREGRRARQMDGRQDVGHNPQDVFPRRHVSSGGQRMV